jgi:hypothetical protein
MATIFVTGSGGPGGSETCYFFLKAFRGEDLNTDVCQANRDRWQNIKVA